MFNNKTKMKHIKAGYNEPNINISPDDMNNALDEQFNDDYFTAEERLNILNGTVDKKLEDKILIYQRGKLDSGLSSDILLGN